MMHKMRTLDHLLLFFNLFYEILDVEFGRLFKIQNKCYS